MSALLLLDVNVLLALAWPNHQHHAEARDWFLARGRAPWATCPTTQCGFVRLSSNPAFSVHARPPGEALALLRTLTERPGHQFLPEELPLTAPGPAGVLERAVGHRQVADAFLIAVAAAHGAGLTTFDAGMRALAPDGVEIVVLGSRRG